jgi:hypothetical protein
MPENFDADKLKFEHLISVSSDEAIKKVCKEHLDNSLTHSGMRDYSSAWSRITGHLLAITSELHKAAKCLMVSNKSLTTRVEEAEAREQGQNTFSKSEVTDAIQSLNSLIDGEDDALGATLTPVISLLEKIVTPMINTAPVIPAPAPSEPPSPDQPSPREWTPSKNPCRLAVGVCNGGSVGMVRRPVVSAVQYRMIDVSRNEMLHAKKKLAEAGMIDCDMIVLISPPVNPDTTDVSVSWWNPRSLSR